MGVTESDGMFPRGKKQDKLERPDISEEVFSANVTHPDLFWDGIGVRTPS